MYRNRMIRAMINGQKSSLKLFFHNRIHLHVKARKYSTYDNMCKIMIGFEVILIVN